MSHFCLCFSLRSALITFFELTGFINLLFIDSFIHVLVSLSESSGHLGIAGNSHLISGPWPLVLAQAAPDLCISPACLLSSGGLSRSRHPPDPCRPGTSPTGPWPAAPRLTRHSSKGNIYHNVADLCNYPCRIDRPAVIMHGALWCLFAERNIKHRFGEHAGQRQQNTKSCF